MWERFWEAVVWVVRVSTEIRDNTPVKIEFLSTFMHNYCTEHKTS